MIPKIQLALFFALAFCLPRAHAQSQQVRAYLQAHNFSSKQLQVGADGRKVNRLFVPVTPQSYISFLSHFNKTTGYLHYNFNGGNNHVAMGLRPPASNQAQDCYLWARNDTSNRGSYMCHRAGDAQNPGGYLFAVKTNQNQLNHMNQWFQKPTTQQQWGSGNCMAWLTNAEVAPGKPIFHQLGLKRSRDGRHMKSKLIHCANSNLEVVGVMVPNTATFNAYGNNALLGAPPNGGDLLGAIR